LRRCQLGWTRWRSACHTWRLHTSRRKGTSGPPPTSRYIESMTELLCFKGDGPCSSITYLLFKEVVSRAVFTVSRLFDGICCVRAATASRPFFTICARAYSRCNKSCSILCLIYCIISGIEFVSRFVSTISHAYSPTYLSSPSSPLPPALLEILRGISCRLCRTRLQSR